MEELSPGQRKARFKAYDLASDLVDQAIETVTNEAIFDDAEAVQNRNLLQEAHDTLKKRRNQFYDMPDDEE